MVSLPWKISDKIAAAQDGRMVALHSPRAEQKDPNALKCSGTPRI